MTWSDGDLLTPANLNDKSLFRGSLLNPMDSLFGAVGNGITDDGPAIQRALDYGVLNKGTVVLPMLPFRIATPIVVTGAVNIVGMGISSALLIDVGVLEDGITSGTGANGSYIYSQRWENFSILGGASCAKNLLVINKNHISEFDLWVRGGCTEYATVVNGCLISDRMKFRTTVNFQHPYIEHSINTMPAGGALRVTAATNEVMPCNAVKFYLVAEGVQGNGLRVDDQGGSGGNNAYCGTIEGCTGQGLYCEGSLNPSFYDIHLEGNQGDPDEINDCRGATLGPNFLCAPAGAYGGTLAITNGSIGTTLDGVNIETLTIAATARRTTIKQIQFGNAGTGTVTDSAGDTVFEGPIIGPSDNNVTQLAGSGPQDPGVLSDGGTFEYWPSGDAAAPQGWSYVGTPSTWAKTGDNLSDTRRHFSRFAAKVTVAATTEGPAMDLDLAACKGRWVTTTSWVYSATGQPRVRAELWIDGGTVRAGPYTDVKDAWVCLRFTGYVPSTAASSVQVVFRGLTTGGAAAAGTFYLGEITPLFGTQAVGAFIAPPNARQNLYLNSQRVSNSSLKPATGSYRTGDIVWNSAGTVVNNGTSDYVITGWYRLTGGSTHTIDVDWAEMRTLTGT